MNLLHSIKALENDSTVNVVIEVPCGSKEKIEYDYKEEKFVLNRVLDTTLSFPFNYGFIPETWEEDNDPLDAIVLNSKPLETGSLVETKIIGTLSTTDEKGKDSKIITVTVSDNSQGLDKKTMDNIEYFYKHYKMIEPNKWVDIDGYLPKVDAEKILFKAIERYHQQFPK